MSKYYGQRRVQRGTNGALNDRRQRQTVARQRTGTLTYIKKKERIRRRDRDIRIYPSDGSVMRIIGTLLLEQSEALSKNRVYCCHSLPFQFWVLSFAAQMTQIFFARGRQACGQDFIFGCMDSMDGADDAEFFRAWTTGLRTGYLL